MYGSYFEYSDLKQNQKNQITESFFGFSDLVLKRKKGKRNKQINGISFVCVLFVGFLNPKQKNKNSLDTFVGYTRRQNAASEEKRAYRLNQQ